MPVPMTTENHPVFVRARQAARARPEFRISSRPVAPITRISNAPVRVLEEDRRDAIVLGSSFNGETAPPVEVPPPDPIAPQPAPPEIVDIPPSQVPLPTHQPPGMPPPQA